MVGMGLEGRADLAAVFLQLGVQGDQQPRKAHRQQALGGRDRCTGHQRLCLRPQGLTALAGLGPVYARADIIDTYVYRLAFTDANYSLGTAIGLLKSVVGFILIVIGYRLAKKYSDYSIF